MPGKHVRFEGIPSTPPTNYNAVVYSDDSDLTSPSNSIYSISPPHFNHSGSPHAYSSLPHVACRISPLLSATERLIYYDLTLPSRNAVIRSSIFAGHRDMDGLATEPALEFIIIACDMFKQEIPVRPSRPAQGVTVMDVLDAVYMFLRQPLSSSEFTQLSQERQWRVYAAFERRYQSILDEKYHALEKAKGIKRVDLLEEKKMFAGLRRTMRGPEVWELCVYS
ncbi:hypothetical protein H0H93_002056 [Arthromyces matolae]|nr:hypothetical protein H0H93_002056 [Arthromyces matolae]